MADQLKSGLNGEIFVDKNTAFIVEKYDPKDLVEKESGDSKVPDKFIPQQKVMRWDNEVNFSVRLVHDEKTPDVVIEGDSVVWRGEKVEAKFYDVFNDEHPEGAGEFEIILKEKPATNVVEFSLNTKGLDFFYQPALTPEEIEQGSERPENVIGSYAVYASEQKTNWVGGKEYKTGKVGHIFRPQIEDANGVKVWGELNVDTVNGILSVTIPQDFLDNAVYPVRHAAGLTFGYTSQGASVNDNGASVTNYQELDALSAAGGGTLTNVSAYINPKSNDIRLAFYSNSGTTPASRLAREASVWSGGATGWKTNASAFSYTLGASTQYWVAIFFAASDGQFWYDTGGSKRGKWEGADTPATASPTDDYTNIHASVYATYTASGGGSAAPTLMLMGMGT